MTWTLIARLVEVILTIFIIFPFDSLLLLLLSSFGMCAGHTEMVDYLHKAMTDHDDAQRKAHADRWEQNDKTNEEEGLKHREKMKNPCTSIKYIFFAKFIDFFFSRLIFSCFCIIYLSKKLF